MIPKLLLKYKKKIPNHLLDFIPFPKIESRKKWENIDEELKKEILKEGNKAYLKIKRESWPQILAKDFMEFSKNGNRVNFENIFFSRRNLLLLQVLAECIEHKGKYIPNIIDGIFLLCEESAWQLPAHNSYRRNQEQDNLPDNSRPIIDLFAAESSANLSLIYFLLKSELDKISPYICKRIENEINKRIIEPYLKEHFWWMGNEEEKMCNWTPWISQNILISVLLMPSSKKNKIKIIKKILYSLDCFLKDYGDDGACSEGAEYYRHAALCFFNCVDIINIVTNQKLSEIFYISKIKNIAEFIYNMNIPHSDYFFNFADCSPMAGKCGAREFLFGEKIKSDELCFFASEQWNSSSVEEKILNINAESLNQSNLYYILQSIFTEEKIKNYYSKNKKLNSKNQNKNLYLESNGIFIVHKNNFSLAVKAGNNADSHNHNDVGSFTIYKNSKPFLIDLGVESYTKKTFSPQRYEIWTMQSAWHNLPTINGIMEKDGEKYCATNILTKENQIQMDIANAFPKEAKLKTYQRKIVACKDFISLEDYFECTNENPKAELSLIVCEKPNSSKDKKSIQVGKLGKIIFENPQEFEIDEVKINDIKLSRTWKKSIYRIRIKLKSNKIKIKFE